MADRVIRLGEEPNPKQVLFFKSRARHTAYGGARGGGKSWAMRTKFVMLAAKYPGLQLLLMRRTLPELKENHILPLLQLLSGYATYRQSDHEFLFPNGSRIKCGYCDAESDVYQYQGQQYDVIGMEEATLFTEAQRDFIVTCNRPSNAARPILPPRMYYTCNPGGVGHAWVKRLFIDRAYRESERPEDYVFIPATIADNRYLMEADPDYVRQLENLPEDLRRAHLEGDWDVLAGQYFREWRRGHHVVTPFQIPDWWQRFRSIDWGYNDPCAVYWHAVDPEGRVYTYRELYIRETMASDVARRIAELSAGENVRYTVVSPDMWQKRGVRDIEGESVAEIFAHNGVPVLRADNSREIGWSIMREFMADQADGKPLWLVFDTCSNLIRTIPLATHDAHRVEDVSGTCEDHALESCRYALMSRPRPSRKPEKRKAPVFDPLADRPERRSFMSI